MIILTIRSDKPQAEIGLYKDYQKLAYEIWEAHRALAETLHTKITHLLKSQDFTWQDVQALAVYEGPGSFTGLRIGISAANALAYSNHVPIAGATGENWLELAVYKILGGNSQNQVVPQYGMPPHITVPKK